MSIKHNPEFTTIELYQAYADYEDMMDLTEDMIAPVAKDVFGYHKLNIKDSLRFNTALESYDNGRSS